MKKSQITITLVLLASIIGTIAVYQLYVKVRYTELKDHKTQEAALRSKISDLDSKFYGTKPEIVLDIWKQKKQPWFNAITLRTDYFQLREIEEVEMPEKAVWRFWYSEHFPKLKKKLEDMAFDSGTVLNTAAVQFNIKTPDDYGLGSDPKRGEIKGNIELYQYGIEMTKLLIDHKANTIDSLVMWAPRELSKGRTGKIMKSTTGYEFTITWKNLVSLLESLRTETQHYTIETIKVTQSQMKNEGAPLTVSMVVAQAWYEATKSTTVVAANVGGDSEASSMMTELFGKQGGGGGRTGGRISAPKADSEGFFRSLWFKLMPF